MYEPQSAEDAHRLALLLCDSKECSRAAGVVGHIHARKKLDGITRQRCSITHRPQHLLLCLVVETLSKADSTGPTSHKRSPLPSFGLV